MRGCGTGPPGLRSLITSFMPHQRQCVVLFRRGYPSVHAYQVGVYGEGTPPPTPRGWGDRHLATVSLGVRLGVPFGGLTKGGGYLQRRLQQLNLADATALKPQYPSGCEADRGVERAATPGTCVPSFMTCSPPPPPPWASVAAIVVAYNVK